MAVAWGTGSQTGSQESGTTLTLTKPTGLAEGELLLAFCYVLSSTAWSTPSGWTAIGGAATGAGASKLNVFAKKADSSDVAASNFTFTGGTSGDIKYGVLGRITGDFSASATLSDYFTQDVDSSITPSGGVVTGAGGVTPKSSNALFLTAVVTGPASGDVNASFSSFTVANNNPSWTEVVDLGVQDSSSGAYIQCGLAYGTYASNAASGDYTVTTTRTSSTHGMVLVSINETTNASITPTVVTMTANPQAPTATGSATLTAPVVTITSSTVTPTIAATEAKWKNTDKSNTSPTITNPDKS